MQVIIGIYCKWWNEIQSTQLLLIVFIGHCFYCRRMPYFLNISIIKGKLGIFGLLEGKRLIKKIKERKDRGPKHTFLTSEVWNICMGC